jgi:hypothetical protein
MLGSSTKQSRPGTRLACRTVLSSADATASALWTLELSRLNTQPALTPVNASAGASRPKLHDSGTAWRARPSMQGTSTLGDPLGRTGAPHGRGADADRAQEQDGVLSRPGHRPVRTPHGLRLAAAHGIEGQPRTLTSAMIDSRDFLAAKEARRQRSTPTARPEDRRHRRPRLQRSSPDLGSVRQIHAKHPDMVLLHGGSPKGAELIAAKWATNRKVPQIAFKPDWTKHANAAPFKAQRRDATMCCRSASWCSPAPASRTISPTRPERSAFRSGGSAPAARERRHLHSESGRSLLRSRAPAARSAQ